MSVRGLMYNLNKEKVCLVKGLTFHPHRNRNTDNIDAIKYFISLGLEPNDDTWKACSKNLQSLKWLESQGYKLSNDMYTTLYSESEDNDVKDLLFDKFDNIKLEIEPITRKLQPGIIENIMTTIYNVTKNYKYRLLNRQIYNETKQSFYNIYNGKHDTITQSETINYFNTLPERFGFIGFRIGQDQRCILQSSINYFKFNSEIKIYSNIEKLLTASVSLSGNESTVENNIMIEVIKYSISELIKRFEDNIIPYINYDILTLYNTYKNRINLMKINNNYAKEMILKLLDINKKGQTKSFLHTYCYYQYLLLSCYVFNILDNPEYLEKLQTVNFEHIPDIPMDNKDNLMIDYFTKIFDKPIDISLHNQQKIMITREINRLELLVKNYIIYELI